MARIQIIGTKRCLTNAVPILQRLGAIQIDTWSETRLPLQRRMTQNSEMIRLRERLAYLTTQVEAILAVLPGLEVAPSYEYDDHHIRSTEWLLDTVETSLAELSPQVQSLTTQRDQLEEKLNSLPRYETTLRQLLPLLPTLIELEHYVVTVIWVERRYQMALEAITQNLEELTDGRCNVISRAVDKDNLAAVLVFPKAQAGAVSTLLGQENISQVRLPTEFADQPLEKALANIRQQLQDIPRQLAEIDAQQKKLAQHWLPRLLMWQALLRDHLAQIDVYTSFGQTDYTFVIEGWVPRRRLAEVETALARGIGDEVVITEVPIRPDEQELVPVAFDNPLFIRPFEPLVGLLALPKYGGLDPTPLMAIFMPIFFGLILGDIAYGAILLVLMIYLRQRLKAPSILRSLAEVLMVGSVWSIVFGFLFGEFFGTLGESFGIHPLWFDRGHNVQALFLLTIGIGAGHVVLGLCLGAWQAMQQHSHHELIEKIAMLASLMALFLLVATLTDFLPDPFFTLAIAALVVGLAVLIYSMRGLGILLAPLELLGVVGNILSYLRLAAIGLSSVYLAQVSNQLAGVFGNLMVGLIIASLFHALNIALGAFSPTIQSLRLHYVEFFSKFYQGGGQPFHPFQRSVVRR
jgi:V/A-type H+-transporting ATPase subunit I